MAEQLNGMATEWFSLHTILHTEYLFFPLQWTEIQKDYSYELSF
jgi:hypothetical protein